MSFIFYTLTISFLAILLWIKFVEWMKKNNRVINYHKINFKIAIPACLALVIILMIEFLDHMNFSIWPIYLKWSYLIALFLAVFFWIIIINRFTANNKFSLEYIFFYPLAIILNILFGFLIISVIIQMIPLVNEPSFFIIILAMILFSYILVEQFRLLAGITKKLSVWRITLATIVTYIFLNGFILFAFGIYNLHFGIASFQVPSNANFSHFLLAGGEFFFEFPSSLSDQITLKSELLIYVAIIQYFVGLLVNILILPFSISYFSSLVSNKANQDKLPQVTEEFINIGDGI